MEPVYSGGNQLTLLDSGSEYFPALLAAIGAARTEIRLETYIYADDPTIRAVTDALCDAARRGVLVCVLVDGFGTRDMPEHFAHQFQAAGVQLRAYRRPSLLRPLRGLRRLHRKLVAIDGTLAFVGGINLVDDYNAPTGMAPRRDLAIRAAGPVAAEVAGVTLRLWQRTGLRRTLSRAISGAGGVHGLRDAWQRHRPDPPPGAILAAQTDAPSPMRAALVLRDNLLHRRDIERAYLTAIRGATQEILIASAYFFPPGGVRRALMRASRRGVAVTLLLQGPSDHPLHKAAEIHLYRTLLRGGIRIFEYSTSFLHVKAAVIDARWATVGSSNFDPFSLWLSHEANLVSDDAGFAAGLQKTLRDWIAQHGREVDLPSLGRQRWWSRLAQWLAFHLSRRAAAALNLRHTRGQ